MALFLAGPLAAADGENAEIGEALEPAVGSLGFDRPGRLQAGYRDFT